MKRKQTEFLKLCLADALIKLMDSQDYDAINVNAICRLAGVGRTTFYRHFNHKNSKEELLTFKLNYEWEYYAQKHDEDVKKDKGFAMLNYIYENKRLFSLFNNNGLIVTIMRLFEELIPAGEPYDKSHSYLMSFFPTDTSALSINGLNTILMRRLSRCKSILLIRYRWG